MTTNQSLTAAQELLTRNPFKGLYDSLSQAEKFAYDKLGIWPNWERKFTGEELAKTIEAYAAQQNAELVAENTKLTAYVNEYAKRIAELHNENERLKQALQNVIKNDKTYYNHHDPRPDGRLPKEDGGTIWLTPKEIAKRALPQPPKEADRLVAVDAWEAS